MNRRMIVSLVLFGIAGMFFAVAVSELSFASSITTYLVTNPDTPCDMCQMFHDVAVTWVIIYVFIGAIVATVGAVLLITGYIAQRKVKQKQLKHG